MKNVDIVNVKSLCLKGSLLPLIRWETIYLKDARSGEVVMIGTVEQAEKGTISDLDL